MEMNEDQIRKTYLYNLSHDVRTPLNAIMGLSALAKDHVHDPERMNFYLEEINKAGAQLLELEQRVRRDTTPEEAKEEHHHAADPDWDETVLVGKRILLAEDIDINAIVAQEILSSKGLIVERAQNGRECVNMLMNTPNGYYDAVLMDIQMPEMDGHQATEAIRNLHDREKATIPIIAMTANTFIEDRLKALGAGMTSHVGKPINVEQLLEAICKAISFKDYYVDNAELSAFREKYYNLGCPCGYFVYHADGEEELVGANAATALIFGCEDSEEFMELVGGSFRGMVHPEDLDGIEAEINEQQARSKSAIDRIAYRIIRKDGQVRNVVDIGYKGFDGKDILYYVYIADITDVIHTNVGIKPQTEGEDEWRSEHRMFTAFLNGLSREYHTIWMVDKASSRMRLVRQASTERHTRDAIQAVAQSELWDEPSEMYIERFVEEGDRERLRKEVSFGEILEQLSHKDRYEVNFHQKWEDGLVHNEQMVFTNAETDDGGQYFICGFRNTDAIVQEEQERMQLLAAASEAKSTFLFNMSHDIRTPMNAIVGFTNMLDKQIGDDNPTARDYIGKIQNASGFLLSLIDNVLGMARIESGKTVVDQSYANAVELADSVISSFEPQMQAKNLTFIPKLEITHTDIMTDSTKIREIFLNILSNAVKYTPEGGTIWATLVEEPASRPGYMNLRTTIADNGIGMSEDFLPHLFENFARAEDVVKGEMQGTGLGMPIVQKLVTLLNGTIQVESELGKGSTFVVEIPVRIVEKSEYSKERIEVTEADYELLRGKKILLAEDIDVNAEIAKFILEEKGMIIDRVADGVDCVDRMEKSDPGTYDLILMDIQMPTMDGYQATRLIRRLKDQEKANIPILAMTANAFNEDREQTLIAGMNGHVAKPFQPGDLYAAMINAFRFKEYRINNDELDLFRKKYEKLGCPCGYFVYEADSDEKVTYVDNQMISMFGCGSIEEFYRYIGDSFREIVHPDDYLRIQNEIEHQQKYSDKNLDIIDYRITRKDGEVRKVRDIGYKVFNGEAMVFYVYLADVTELEER